MKKKRIFSKSLSFQKETITKLNEQQLSHVHGGGKVTDDMKCSCPVMSCNHMTDSCLTDPKPTEEEVGN